MGRRYLIINPFGIGDVLFTTPMIESIKSVNPECKIAYLCNKRAKAVLENNPNIDTIYVYERDEFEALKKKSIFLWLKKMLELISMIKSEKYDLVFDCSLNTQYGFIAMLAGIKKRVGFDYKERSKFLNCRIKLNGYEDKHVIDYYQDLLESVGIIAEPHEYKLFLNSTEKDEARQWLRKSGFNSNGRLIALAPGGGASWGKDAYKKQWPIDKWIALAKEILQDDKNMLFVCAAPGEEGLASQIMEIDSQRVISSESLRLRLFMAVLQECQLMVANDGGPLHMAAALGLPTVGIFGPVDKKVYGACSLDKDKNINLSLGLECQPCYKRFRLSECKQDNRCLKALEVTDVYSAVLKLLEGYGKKDK